MTKPATQRPKTMKWAQWLGSAGILLLLPGIFWIWNSGSRLTNQEAHAALEPLIAIPLDQLDQNPVSVKFRIPVNARWNKIRRIWGEPDLVIMVADVSQDLALCLTDVPVGIQLVDQSGRDVALQPDRAFPYGYSTTCAESTTLNFHASPGAQFTLTLTPTHPGTPPSGALYVLSSWSGVKDKLMTVSLNEDAGSLAKWPSIFGALLVLASLVLFIVNWIGRKRKA